MSTPHDASEGGGHASAEHQPHANPLRMYIGVFAALTAVTAFEMLPLFGILDLPGPLLLALSALKFLAVCSFFMHLWGDHPIFSRLFYIPLVMVIGTVMVLMALFGSWTLSYRTNERGTDTEEVFARYRGVYEGPCNSWVKSAFTGNEYCSSPWIGFTSAAVYEAGLAPVADIPEFAGWDTKTPEEKQAVLMAVGETVYTTNCGACHQATGLGLAGVFPPLANDPMVAGPAEAHISVVLKGMTGVAIGGVTYASAMPAWPQLSDQQLAAVITFERNSWGNKSGIVEPAQVAALR
ncbi:MAG: c-type cytochrome [Pseudomonadota bacterium]|nr:c-type cytochrome [Pseudomonadota bacterium]